jgi:UDP-N-acetylglucosamine 2-epimerase (non-hydrolysing)
MKRILVVVGTRPEAIKMAPLIKRLRDQDWCETIVVATAQHRELLDQVFALFGIKADADLDIMRPGQSLAQVTSRLFDKLDTVMDTYQPDMVLAQGDTTTVMVAALIAFYRQIPFGHVEAGLRTNDLLNPFPEELNRVIAGRVARLHFAPTATAAAALKAEATPEDSIFVTGNTVVDALLDVAAAPPALPVEIPEGSRVILLTTHRRENFGKAHADVFEAIRQIVAKHADVHVIFPVHPNPNVRAMAKDMLGCEPRIHLTEPLGYGELVAALKSATLVLTDSGGIQEEAPVLAKPVLVLRSETERPEAVQAGVARLLGTDCQRIIAEASRLLNDPEAYAGMARSISPYGDGMASNRIISVLRSAMLGEPMAFQEFAPKMAAYA